MGWLEKAPQLGEGMALVAVPPVMLVGGAVVAVASVAACIFSPRRRREAYQQETEAMIAAAEEAGAGMPTISSRKDLDALFALGGKAVVYMSAVW